ncbi:hypothetical protein SKAU_G00098900 [Synaphobranchus kaupii]|uniref:Uncharacterized protein n=1 Tax=Synaphobranchus kaupii TaxID=118154 RepID=A0A9Q1FYR2_SYNKA|nr:hypothetical protein SKAU_G00098900 [Synaphobranchus kaupii]
MIVAELLSLACLRRLAGLPARIHRRLLHRHPCRSCGRELENRLQAGLGNGSSRVAQCVTVWCLQVTLHLRADLLMMQTHNAKVITFKAYTGHK